MLERLLLHDSTVIALQALAKEPPQGLLLVGPRGIGKTTVAGAWADAITTHRTDVHTVTPDERGTITIEAVRDLYRTTRAKQAGRQVVIIEQAEAMSLEAENALLKLLEEPRQGLTFVLTTLSSEALLPTVLSRIQRLNLQPLGDETIRQLIVSKKPGIAQSELAQIVFLAQGRPAIGLSLLEADALNVERERMQLVKQLLVAVPYERFRLIGKLNDRDTCMTTLNAMMRVVEAQIKAAPSKSQLSSLLHITETLEQSLSAVGANGNVRAQLLRLFSSY